MAPWPSGKAELCQSFTPRSNLGGASKLLFMLYASQRIAYFLSLIFRGIAQLVEQRSPKPRAEGSSPSAPATSEQAIYRLLLLFRKKSRSVCLFEYIRTHNGKLSLPPFCDLAKAFILSHLSLSINIYLYLFRRQRRRHKVNFFGIYNLGILCYNEYAALYTL